MYKRFLAAAVLVASSSMAHADGASVKDYAVVTAAPVWTGLYVGAHAGGAWTHQDLSNAISTPATPGFTPPGLPLGSFDSNDFVGGLNIGFNYDFNGFLLGVEADINWVDAGTSRGFATTTVPSLPFALGTTLDHYETLRARAGLTFDSTLLYVTGGFAWAKTKADVTSPGLLAGPFSTSSKANHSGWTIGGGAEYLFDRHWVIGIEYKHIDLGHEDYTFAFPLAPVTTRTDVKIDDVTARVKYKF